MTLRFSLREHEINVSWPPNVTFSKPSGSVLRVNSDVIGISGGYIFIVVPRAWLQDKYLRFNWRGTKYVSMAQVCNIYDGSYDRSSDIDFPSGSGLLTKGAGKLQDVASRTGNLAWTVEDVQVDVSGGSEDLCTIFILIADSWNSQQGYFEIDWFEINESAGGVDNKYGETFNDSVHMEKTGSYGDYGYISDGEVPTTPIIETDEAINIGQTSGTLKGDIAFEGTVGIDERGFEWGIQTGVYPNSWTESGSFGAGEYTHALSELTQGVKIYFRAKIHESGGIWYYGSEKAFTPDEPQATLRFSDVEPPAKEPHRSIYADLKNLPDPMKLNLGVRIFNYDDIALYMKVDGYNGAWTFTEKNLGSLGSGANAYYLLEEFGSRTKPAAETSETITVRLRAYSDAGYSDLRWTFERVIDLVIINSNDGSWTEDEKDDFDDGTVQGWTEVGVGGTTHGIRVKTDYVLSTPYSCQIYSNHTSTPGHSYERFQKSFATPNKNKVFAIADIRLDHSTITLSSVFIRAEVDDVIKINAGGGVNMDTWFRIVLPLPPNEAVVKIEIGSEQDYLGYGVVQTYMDDFRIISKD